jgi:CelD/BcsL family acetyltransferase involved in cellulose biosynthesis
VLTTEVITDSAGFARLAPAWRALESTRSLPSLFIGFSWQYEWWKALGGGRELRLLVARDGDDVQGVLPLYEESSSGVKRLAFVGSAGGGGDYLDVLYRDASARRHLLHEAMELGADLLELGDMDSESPTIHQAFVIARHAGQYSDLVPRYPCPYIPITTSFTEYLDGVGRRDNLKRRVKWFATQPGFRITCETAPEAVAPFLARFFRLHAARWHDDGGSQAFSDPRLVRFHHQIAQRLAEEGRLRLWTLWVAGEAVAVAYGIDDGTRSLYYQSGFLPEWGSRSAGLVLFARYLEDAFERGLTEIDLLRGAEAYKTEWAKQARQTVTLRWALTRRGRTMLQWEDARERARTLARQALPEQARVRMAQVIRGARMVGAH